ncbi:FliA/WhiG family RNA polymerase sigma factor [Pantoea sp. A4]|uniref:FliA/WhiG family RNA polymerase sigma factor n=1 Tax=Pantoea sp. A4 TaxID=1225184 RepID=UPI0003607D2D|nr:FliA/WhiG family RNA polymerase sigma factor [Pantoea sp. A4]
MNQLISAKKPIKAPITPADECRYLQQWSPLVKRIVRQLLPQTDSVVGSDDLQQVALLGLLQSLRRYGHPDEQFGSYAQMRVRGAVLDYLRQHDWRPRRLRQRTHKINDGVRALTRELGHEPREEEVCQHLNISHAAYRDYVQQVNAKEMESLDELLANTNEPQWIDSAHWDDEFMLSRSMQQALATLQPREKMVLCLYYQYERNLREIALMLSLTEARVCQINKQAGQKIKRFFEY